MTGETGPVAAFGGGVRSFAAPCVPPLVPVHLSGGHRPERVIAPGRRPPHQRQVAWTAGGFVAGFTAGGRSPNTA